MKNNYIALGNLDFSWDKTEIPKVIRYWDSGYSLDKISVKINRRIEDVFLLLYDLSLKEKIKERKGGLFGSKED